MSKLDELLDKRQKEIDADELARRKDKENYDSAVKSGIWGAVVGAGAGFLVYIALYIVIGIIVGIHNLASDPKDQWLKDSSTISVIGFFLCVIIVAIIGYNVNFSLERRNMKH